MVLHSAPWCSRLAWGSSGGVRWDVGVGVPAGGRDTGKQGPNQRRRQSHPQLLVFVTGPGNNQVAGKYPFLCQTCVINLRVIVPYELSEHLSYR